MVGPELLLHASDHPHNHGTSAAALYDLLDDITLEQAQDANAAALYGLAPAN